MTFLFVGERPSARAHRNGWTWVDGRLCSKNLFDALAAAGIDPTYCGFVNLFGDTPDAPLKAGHDRVAMLRGFAGTGVHIVALGNRVSSALARSGVMHTKIRHPAARGAGRKQSAYRAHVEAKLVHYR